MVHSPDRRIPNLLHLLLFLALTLSLLFAAEIITVVLFREPLRHAVVDEKVQLLVTATVYLLALAAAVLLFPALWGRSFAEGIRWNSAGAKPWLGIFGLALGLTAEVISSHLPAPREMPIEDVFRTPGIIWFMVVFGTLLAPLFEEVVFRGLLLPALANAFDWLRLPHEKTEVSELAHGEWHRSEEFSTAALVVSSLLTSLLFAAIHAPQLGFNWAPVALLVCVSLVLCVVRIWTDSVAASTLVHGSYNLAAFVLIFVSTSGFQHMHTP